jgi:hypothetical protein
MVAVDACEVLLLLVVVVVSELGGVSKMMMLKEVLWGGKREEERGAMRKIGQVLFLLLCSLLGMASDFEVGARGGGGSSDGGSQMDVRADESVDSIAGCGRPKSGMVEMVVVPSRVVPRR